MSALFALLLSVAPWSPSVVLEGQAGLGAPSGYLGLGLDVTLQPWWAVNAAGGVIISGPQWAVTNRFQTTGSSHWGLGLGVSGGPNQTLGRGLRAHWDHAVWLNTEVDWVKRRDDLQIRFALGYGYLLNDESCRWTDLGVGCDRWPASILAPYFQFAMGYVF